MKKNTPSRTTTSEPAPMRIICLRRAAAASAGVGGLAGSPGLAAEGAAGAAFTAVAGGGPFTVVGAADAVAVAPTAAFRGGVAPRLAGAVGAGFVGRAVGCAVACGAVAWAVA